MMSPERARTLQIVLAVVGFGVAGLSQVEGILESGYLPWLVRGLAGGVVLGLGFFRRQSFLRANEQVGNRLLAQHLEERERAGVRLSEAQERFVSRLLDPWWRNGYWLIAGARELKPPGSS